MMIKAEEMQAAMHNQMRQMIAKGLAIAFGFCADHTMAKHYVPQTLCW